MYTRLNHDIDEPQSEAKKNEKEKEEEDEKIIMILMRERKIAKTMSLKVARKADTIMDAHSAYTFS